MHGVYIEQGRKEGGLGAAQRYWESYIILYFVKRALDYLLCCGLNAHNSNTTQTQQQKEETPSDSFRHISSTIYLNILKKKMNAARLLLKKYDYDYHC